MKTPMNFFWNSFKYSVIDAFVPLLIYWELGLLQSMIRCGSGQIGPRVIFCGKLGPGRLGPSKLGPGNFLPRQIGPQKIRWWQIGPQKFLWRQIGPRKSFWRQIVFHIFLLDIYCQQFGNIWTVEYICIMVLDIFWYSANNWQLYSGIGYILPTIGRYMSILLCLCALQAQGCRLWIY